MDVHPVSQSVSQSKHLAVAPRRGVNVVRRLARQLGLLHARCESNGDIVRRV